MPVTPVNVDDFVEIAVPFMSLLGTTLSSSLEWHPIELEPMPDLADIRAYNRSKNITPHRNRYQKYFADLSRVCEVEDTVEEWFEKQYIDQICQQSLKLHLTRQIDGFLHQLSQMFKIDLVEVGGIDFSVWKLYLTALSRPDCVINGVYYSDINFTLKVTDSDLVNEVKKVGVIIDRGQELQMRAGDRLIIYLSMGGYTK